MRVAFITQEYPPELIGGAGTYAKKLTDELDALGHEIIIFTPIKVHYEDKFPRVGRIKIVPIRILEMPFSAPLFWIKTKEAIKKEENNGKFDIIHINGPVYWFLIMQKITQAPLVLTLHHLSGDAANSSGLSLWTRLLSVGSENGYFVQIIEKNCVFVADKIIAVSDYTRNQIISRYSLTVRKITTVYEAADLPQNFELPIMRPWREELNIGNSKMILFVGRLNDPRKGLDLLLKAFSLSTDLNDCFLVIVGKGDEDRIMNISTELGINNKIKIVGYLNNADLWDIYRVCDLYVVPSRLEGFGLTLLDAMSAGKKIVATSVGAIPEIAGPGTILVEPNDSKALSDAIIHSLNSDGPSPEKIKEYSARFSWLKAAQQTEAVYYETLDGN